MTKKESSCKVVLTSKHPKWLDNKVPESFFDEDLYRIILFFVFYSPCRNYCTQGRNLQYYGWKEGAWDSDSYLKDKLDRASQMKYFVEKKRVSDLPEIFNQTEFGKNFFNNINVERAAFYNSERNKYMSLFYHIRCSLAHGRMTMFPIDGNDIVLVMENVKESGKSCQVRARMVLRKSTLLNWVDIITAGPQENE